MRFRFNEPRRIVRGVAEENKHAHVRTGVSAPPREPLLLRVSASAKRDIYRLKTIKGRNFPDTANSAASPGRSRRSRSNFGAVVVFLCLLKSRRLMRPVAFYNDLAARGHRRFSPVREPFVRRARGGGGTGRGGTDRSPSPFVNALAK